VSNSTTFYPGVGADDAMRELRELVGQITATWAEVEDQLFHVFVVALAGTFYVQDLKPYRAAFFARGSYENKMRMTNEAMKARYAANTVVIEQWNTLRRAMDGFSSLRNEVAHLIPMAKSSTDRNVKANVRLVPAFWKNAFKRDEFDQTGYSLAELWQALKPYWGSHPRISLEPPAGDEASQLAYRVQHFASTLSPPSR
jgi:hypothetical protein